MEIVNKDQEQQPALQGIIDAQHKKNVNAVLRILERKFGHLTNINITKTAEEIASTIGRKFDDTTEARRDIFVRIGGETNEASQFLIKHWDDAPEHDVLITGLSAPMMSDNAPGKKSQLQLHLVNITEYNEVVAGTIKTGKYRAKGEPNSSKEPIFVGHEDGTKDQIENGTHPEQRRDTV